MDINIKDTNIELLPICLDDNQLVERLSILVDVLKILKVSDNREKVLTLELESFNIIREINSRKEQVENLITLKGQKERPSKNYYDFK